METREGYKETKIGWIPEDWGVKQVAEIAEVLLSNVDKKIHAYETDVMLCNYMDAYNNDYISMSINFMSATASNQEIEKFSLYKDDVLITKDSETENDIAQSAVVVDDLDGVLCGYHLAVLRPMNNNVDGKFLMNSIKSTQVHNYFVKLANGVTRFGLNKASINGALIPLPPLPEQQKIASILTTVDDKISSIDQQIQQTELLKKGLMEKLLIEGIGHTEFKDTKIGKIPDSWDYGTIKELSNGTQNGLYKSKNHYGIGYEMVHMPDIFANEYIIEGTMKKVQLSDSEIKSHQLFEGDLLFARRSLVPEGSGKCCLVGNLKNQISFESSIIRVSLKTKKLFPLFAFYFMSSHIGRKEMMKYVRRVAVSGITGKDLQKYNLPLPPLQEQQQIASILSTVDEKIDVLQSKKTSYTTLKKGLMVQLLTGQMRVKI